MTQIRKVEPIRLLCLADTHGDLPEAIPAGEFAAILHAGDLDTMRDLRKLERQARRVWRPLLFVRGNHDSKDLLPDSANDISGRALRIADGLVIAGVGCAIEGELLPSEDDVADACVETLAATVATLRAGDRLVLLSHYPPFLDGSKAYSSVAPEVFNAEIGAFVADLKPLAVIHGHHHELQGHQEKWRGTLVACAGPDWGLLTVDVERGTARYSPWVPSTQG